MSLEKTIPVSFRLPKWKVELLKSESRKISYERGEDCSWVDLVRDITDSYLDRQGLLPRENSNEYPNIITFCESDKWLGLERQGIELSPIQKSILRVFYDQSVTEGDIDEIIRYHVPSDSLLEKEALRDHIKSNIGKFDNIYGMMGRRAGKDFLLSIMVLYEAMKLLEYKCGSPQKAFSLNEYSSLTILLIGRNAYSSKVLFLEVQEKMLRSSYFSNKFSPEGLLRDKIYLSTKSDRKINSQRTRMGLPLVNGSVVIQLYSLQSCPKLSDSLFIHSVFQSESLGGILDMKDLSMVMFDKETAKNKHICPKKVVFSSYNILFDDLVSEKISDSNLSFRIPTWAFSQFPQNDIVALCDNWKHFSDIHFSSEFACSTSFRRDGKEENE